MGVLLDVLGAIVIGGLLLIMLISFNYQIREIAERNMYAAQMTEHMDGACMRLNYIIGLAGAGVDPYNAVIEANPDYFIFKTYWNFEQDMLEHEGYFLEPSQGAPIEVSIKLVNLGGSTGKSIQIVREGMSDPVEDLGYIFWVDDMQLKYYDINDNLLTVTTGANKQKIRSVEFFLTFKRPAPLVGDRPLTNNLQLKCYMMNAFMQEGLS